MLLVLDRRMLDSDLAGLAGLAAGGGSVTVVVVTTIPRSGPLSAFADLAVDTRLVLSIEQFVAGIFPALDPIASTSTMPGVASADAVGASCEPPPNSAATSPSRCTRTPRSPGEPSVWVDQFDAEAELQELLA